MSTARMLRLAFIGVLVVAIWLGIEATARASEEPMVYPDTPCSLQHRMDIAIVDGMFWECTCVRLLIGYQCDWMLIAGVTAKRPIKRPKRHHVTRIYAIPAVTA